MICPEPPVRVAMWSGPRTISTAMMRAWENREDTVVVDEPFYAFYLRSTGIDHPGATLVMETGECSWPRVVESLLAPLAEDKTVFFQKHMTLHLLEQVDRSWLRKVLNCFLIRNPRDVITSYIRRRPEATLEDLGFVQQTELYRWVRDNTDQDPPVLDARDVQEHPGQVLSGLCHLLGLPFDERMLSWPRGRRGTDGVWARFWYAAVERSTGFAPYQTKTDRIPDSLRNVYEACVEAYDELYELRIKPTTSA